MLAVLPFSHSYGMTACLNVGVLLVARLILLPSFVYLFRVFKRGETVFGADQR